MSKQRGMHGILGSHGGKEKRRSRAEDGGEENSEPFVMSDSVMCCHEVCFPFVSFCPVF